MRIQITALLIPLLVLVALGAGAENEPLRNTQAETTRLLTPDEALQAITLPEAFRARSLPPSRS